MILQQLLFAICVLADLRIGHSGTNPQDAAALLSLTRMWKNTPPGWRNSKDPCDMQWDGVLCNSSRVISLKLSSMGIQGMLGGEIGLLAKLQILDLSNNIGFGGPLGPEVGNLEQLTTLILSGCNFSGDIPRELGNLPKLSFLALNSNRFNGEIPASLGRLSDLYWLDIGHNQLSGVLPTSTVNSPGLDLLINARHLHFSKNKLSGIIPEKLFNSNMSLTHLLFDGNNFTGQIPASLGLVQTLEVIRLDKNSLVGTVPRSINNLMHARLINLANNKLTGAMPDLARMSFLSYVDLSNNTFEPSITPTWFSKLSSLTTLAVESGGIYGIVPEILFSFPQIQHVALRNNHFNGSLSLGDNISQQLKIVDLQNNEISSFNVNSTYNKSLILIGNPVCNNKLLHAMYCLPQMQPISESYSTNISHCNNAFCQMGESINPRDCVCAYPYKGLMAFPAPLFRDMSDIKVFQSLENSLSAELGLAPASVFLQNQMLKVDNYITLQVDLFPPGGAYFNRTEILRIGFELSNHKYIAPNIFGPYYFIAEPYHFPAHGAKSFIKGLSIKIAVVCAILFMGVAGVCIYIVFQKKHRKRDEKYDKSFESWISTINESSAASFLNSVIWFSYDKIKKATNNFSEANVIGYGASGLVYKGVLPNKHLVAIKRVKEGSFRELEFRNEIELLSRAHHKYLVGLVGFCYEKKIQILVYEYIPNGTLRDSLNGNSGIQLDWRKRLRVALSSSRGLAYLHERTDPPIIHRDIKSTNILLDVNLTAKVADFGLSRWVVDSEKGHVSTEVKGTLGYVDPEYYRTQHLTEKSDVYSFGVLMLELITGRKPIENCKYIVRQVAMALDENDDDDDQFCGLQALIDPQLLTAPNLIGLKAFVDLAMKCVQLSSADRPTMSQIVREIKAILQREGLKTSSTSACSSADIGNASGILNQPVGDSFPIMDGNLSCCSFKFGEGYSLLPLPVSSLLEDEAIIRR